MNGTMGIYTGHHHISERLSQLGSLCVGVTILALDMYIVYLVILNMVMNKWTLSAAKDNSIMIFGIIILTTMATMFISRYVR